MFPSIALATSFLIATPPALATHAAPTATGPSIGAPMEPRDDADDAIKAAGEDVEKLLELARTWRAGRKQVEAKRALERVLEIDPENEEAHKGLRHRHYDGKWFKSYAALAEYRRNEAKRKADAGLARHGDQWVPIADLPFVRMGWTKTPDGEWISPRRVADATLEEESLAEGRQLRHEDSCWVHPDDFDNWRQGLWLCGEEWLDLEKANEYHSKIGTWWRARTERFDVLSTVNLATLLEVRGQVDFAYGHLHRIYGLRPEWRPEVVVLNSLEQYNTFAAGSQGASGIPVESSGFSSMHYAFFADTWADLSVNPPQYQGTGVAYWDAADEQMKHFGPPAVRHAAGLAYVEAIDPSWMTISEAMASSSPFDLGAFWAEKRIPRWLRRGGATYAERYFRDDEAEDPWRMRAWSLSSLKNQGSLDSVEDILAHQLTLEDIEGSVKLINEAGLLVSFMLDGECEPVTKAHEAFKTALAEGGDVAKAVEELEKALEKNEKALKKYAGF